MDTTDHETAARPETPEVRSPLPSVSVVVATRDRPELLRSALRSITSQDYPGRIEVIVVYDQSTPDRSWEAESTPAAGSRIVRVVGNDRTPGLAGARNCGALTATGELLAFCDDDDAWVTEKIGLQQRRLVETGAQVVVGGIIVHYDGKQSRRIPQEADLTLPALIRNRATAAHPSSVMVTRKAFLGPIGLVDEAIPGSYGEDYDWLLRAAKAAHIVCVQRPVVHVLWGATSFFQQKWHTLIEAMDYLERKFPEFAAEPTGLARLYGRKSFAYAALGERRAARHWALRALRLNWRDSRAFAALLVSARVISSQRALHLAHSRGRGI
jgi:glycosyltransferase involved in cell wall biosynthesis